YSVVFFGPVSFDSVPEWVGVRVRRTLPPVFPASTVSPVPEGIATVDEARLELATLLTLFGGVAGTLLGLWGLLARRGGARPCPPQPAFPTGFRGSTTHDSSRRATLTPPPTAAGACRCTPRRRRTRRSCGTPSTTARRSGTGWPTCSGPPHPTRRTTATAGS